MSDSKIVKTEFILSKLEIVHKNQLEGFAYFFCPKVIYPTVQIVVRKLRWEFSKYVFNVRKMQYRIMGFSNERNAFSQNRISTWATCFKDIKSTLATVCVFFYI